MTVFEAKRISMKGATFAGIGAAIGLLMSVNFGVWVIVMSAYVSWALFHGVQMIRPAIRAFFDFGPVTLDVRTIPDLFSKSIQIKLLRLAIVIVAGYCVGICGGAILRQLYLLFIILT